MDVFCSNGTWISTTTKQQLTSDTLGVWRFTGPTMTVPMNARDSRLETEGFHFLGDGAWSRSRRLQRNRPDDFITSDESLLFTMATNVEDPFVKTTHQRVREWSRQAPRSKGEATFRRSVDAIASRYTHQASEEALLRGKAAPDYANPT